MAQQTKTVAELEAAHRKIHKRLIVVEIIGIVILIVGLLSGLVAWALYQQESKAASREPYSSHMYE